MTCGDRLPGLYAGVVLVCELEAGHDGRHEDDQLGPTTTWTDNAYSLLGAAA